MSKADKFLAAAGGSTGRRGAPIAMPNGMGGVMASDGRETGVVRSKTAQVIQLDRIVPDPLQPRTEWDTDEAREELARLAESLKTRGQLQPIRVRWVEDQNTYMVVVGGRRLRAAGIAGLKSLECIVVADGQAEDDVLEDQLVENAVRLANSPLEQARAFERLIAAKGYTYRDLADKLNISHVLVTRAMALLTLPTPIQSAVDAGEIKPTVAYEISKVADADEQAELATQAKAGKLSRDELRTRVTKARTEAASDPAKAAKGRGVAPKRAPAVSKPEPYILETEDYVVTIKWKRPGGPPARRIAGDLVRQLKMEGQGAEVAASESDAA